MNTQRITRAGAASLDRLVDGELDERERSELLRALDREPEGWKRCAMAFLEAQAWREAAAMGSGEHVAAPPAPRRPPALFRQALGIAAAVVVAFGAGFVARQSRAPNEIASGGAAAAGGDALVTRGAPAAVEVPSAVPEYLRRRMEREGYEVKGDRKLVPVALGDGRQVTVPVETVSYRYVGRRIH